MRMCSCSSLQPFNFIMTHFQCSLYTSESSFRYAKNLFSLALITDMQGNQSTLFPLLRDSASAVALHRPLLVFLRRRSPMVSFVTYSKTLGDAVPFYRPPILILTSFQTLQRYFIDASITAPLNFHRFVGVRGIFLGSPPRIVQMRRHQSI